VENPVRAQAVKGKKRTANLEPPRTRGPAPFTQLSKAIKAAVDAGYSVKIELGAAQPTASVTPFEEWKRNRAR
jgi:hypothetical protein